MFFQLENYHILIMFNRIEEKVDFWKQKARKLKLETFALYLAYRHPQTPWYAKIFVGVVVAYAFSPIDLVPDFIPVLGYLDDLILVSLGVTLALKMIPNNVMIECRKWAQVKMREGEPVNWIMVLVILSIWVGLVALSIVWLINLCK